MDPWEAFDKVYKYARQAECDQSSLIILFVLGLPVQEQTLARVLGEEVTQDLQISGMLQLTDEGIKSNYCILSAFGMYLLIEYPALSYGGLLTSSKTYLSSLSYRLIRVASTYISAGKILDLGCGTGLFSMVASQKGQNVLATDIDSSALRLAQANMALNGCSAMLLQTDMFRGIADQSFDLIVFNPPWRLVPPNIAYPNTTARVGSGNDGLKVLREFLQGLPAYLADRSRAIFFVEFPGSERGFDFEAELRAFTVQSGCSIYLSLEKPLQVIEQSHISAQTAWYLNNDLSINELTEQFLRYYKQLGFSLLYPVQCIIHNDGKGRFVHQDKG